MCLDNLKSIREAIIIALIQHFKSQPQNPEFRINPENFHPCKVGKHYLWEVRTIVCPFDLAVFIQFQASLLATGSMPVVGSSCRNEKKQKLRENHAWVKVTN